MALSAAAALGVARPAITHAQSIPALYQATAIVTGTDMRQRPLGFSRCLIEVVVKLTGAPHLATDPAILALSQHPDDLVASFDYVDPRAGILHHDDQGTYDRSYELTVRFDPAKLGAALTRLNIQLWQAKRPLLTPVILVRDREPTPFLLSATAPRGAEMRQALIRAAGELGIGTHLPTENELGEWSVGLIGFPTPLFEPAADKAVVAGSLSWSIQALGWVGLWRMQVAGPEHTGAEHQWTISGVGYDVALANLVRGAVTLLAGTGIP